MSRGKYSAKAASRGAALNGELLAQANTEIAALKQQLIERDAELRRERADRDTLVIKRANELSRDLIAAAHAEASTLHQRLAELGLACWKLFKKYRCRVGGDVSHNAFVRDYAELFGLGDQIHDLFEIAGNPIPLPNRRARRRSLKKIDQLADETRQANTRAGIVAIGWDW